jgi:hypothetical protein
MRIASGAGVEVGVGGTRLGGRGVAGRAVGEGIAVGSDGTPVGVLGTALDAACPPRGVPPPATLPGVEPAVAQPTRKNPTSSEAATIAARRVDVARHPTD